jgi:general secretion pathway protein D
VVNKTAVEDILFVIARDAKLNIDIHPSVSGKVTMSALDQTLTEILDRIARQVDMRYELDGQNLTVMPDSPFLRHYQVEYLSVDRTAKGDLSSNSAVGGSNSGNASSSSLNNKSSNAFWNNLVANLRDLLRETDKVMPGSEGGSSASGSGSGAGGSAAGGSGSTAGSAASPLASALSAATGGGAGAGKSDAKSDGKADGKSDGKSDAKADGKGNAGGGGQVTFREAASVIANPEAGVISVRATQRQHQKVREFIDRAMSNIRRQVMIEGTIIEVELNDEYQQGINWNLLKQTGTLSVQTGAQGGALPSGAPIGGLFPNMATVNASKTGVLGGKFDLTAVLRLLDSFGRTRVLSSPRLSVLKDRKSVV